MAELWQRVQDQQDKCSPHEFIPDEQSSFFTARCAKCSKTVSAGNRIWYERGLAAALKALSDK